MFSSGVPARRLLDANPGQPAGDVHLGETAVRRKDEHALRFVTERQLFPAVGGGDFRNDEIPGPDELFTQRFRRLGKRPMMGNRNRKKGRKRSYGFHNVPGFFVPTSMRLANGLSRPPPRCYR